MLGLLLPKGMFRYVFLPQVMGRFSDLFAGGFLYLPFLLAVVYRNFRLLPADHPYLDSGNIGRYGVRHVVAQAASRLKFSLSHVDQIIMFFVILTGILLILLQLLSMGAMLFFSTAHALPTSWSGFFTINPVTSRTQDLASIMLDMVFGVRHPDILFGLAGIGLFESCAGIAVPCLDLQVLPPMPIRDTDLTTVPALTGLAGRLALSESGASFPWPHHVALHRLFSVYSNGLLVVAVGMVSYFIATILAETAQTGTPFGRRYNKTWVPFRIVMAFGLLMPLGSGLNSAQYIVLFAAKYGSAFATNGWQYFNSSLGGSSTLGSAADLVAKPTVPDLDGFLEFMFVVNVCEVLYEAQTYDADKNPATAPVPFVIEAYVHGPESATTGNTLLVTDTTDYDDVVTMSGVGNNTIAISFGVKDQVLFPSERGFVKPICGEARWTLSDPRLSAVGINAIAPGTLGIQQIYWRLFRDLWRGINNAVLKAGTGIPPSLQETNTANRRDVNFVMRKAPEILPEDANDGAAGAELGQNYKNTVRGNIQILIGAGLTAARVVQGAMGALSTGSWTGIANPLYMKGWAAAGIWYNVIAEINGGFSLAANSLPVPYRFPYIMEKVWEVKLGFETQIEAKERFSPEVVNLDDLSKFLEGKNALKNATVLGLAFKAYNASDAMTTHTRPSGSQIYDIIMMIFGTNGLYDMRENPTTHPLAQLSSMGRMLVDAGVRNLALGTAGVLGGIAAGNLAGGGQLASTFASFMFTIAMITLTIGFVLFYVVPFLPFIYYFFAVSGWVKGIFEALVGAPLWALAHIRIDAHGLPGNAALNGYFLIFEIFVRPILILFGLLASISIYSALVAVLNSIFPSVTTNVGGFNIGADLAGGVPTAIDTLRGKIDQFFFTVMYAVVVYMIGMSSFKLIDTIPNNILRWMGSSVATFNDQREDAAQGLSSKAAMGAQQVSSRMGGALNSMARAAG